MTRRLAYLGPTGTYTEQAALKYDATATLVPCTSIPAVADEVSSRRADEGVVPIENSLEGSVTFTLDILIHETSLFIKHESVVPISHSLVVNRGTTVSDIETVYSHPQALAQCRSFLTKYLPEAALIASLSTSAAVQEMQVAKTVSGAIANRRAATVYDADVLMEDVQDDPSNATRFVVLAPSDHPLTGSDKTSICFEFDHDAHGILYSVLGEFADRGINLAKIESRPTRKSLGRYIFLVDLEGHREDRVMSEALEGVRAQVSMLRIFGSYPMHVSSAV